MDTGTIIKMAITVVIGIGAFIAGSSAKHKIISAKKPKKAEIFHTLMLVLVIICGWYFIRIIISSFADGPGGLDDFFKLLTPRMTLFGISFAISTVIMWIIIAIILILSLIFNFFIFPKFSEKTKGFQNITELSVNAVDIIVGAGAFIARSVAKLKNANEDKSKKAKYFRTLILVLMIICGWYLIGIIISKFAGGPRGLTVNFELFPPRVMLFGISFASSTIITWIIISIILVLSLIFKFILFPRFSEKPKGFQNIMELSVEAMYSFTLNTTGNISDELPAYMFSIAILIVSCAAAELFGIRPPTADLIMTFSLGLATFFLINFLSIKKKGVGGRIKGLASPSPIIFPMKVLSDFSVPVSLACRLFGNMIGGMIVMDLLKSSLGGYSVGLTALAGIYFNLFHPLIQTYIFIILSLTFINEATEDH